MCLCSKKDPIFLLLRIQYVIYTSSSFIMYGFQNIIVTTPNLIKINYKNDNDNYCDVWVTTTSNLSLELNAGSLQLSGSTTTKKEQVSRSTLRE